MPSPKTKSDVKPARVEERKNPVSRIATTNRTRLFTMPSVVLPSLNVKAFQVGGDTERSVCGDGEQSLRHLLQSRRDHSTPGLSGPGRHLRDLFRSDLHAARFGRHK